MTTSLRTALMSCLAPHLGLSKSRLETLAVFLMALIHGRTVNLTHAASQFHGTARHALNYRRLQRFFQYVRLDQGVIALIVVRMLNLSRPKCLALRRISGVDLLKTKAHRIAVYTVLVFMVFAGVYLSLTSSLQPSWRNL